MRGREGWTQLSDDAAPINGQTGAGTSGPVRAGGRARQPVTQAALRRIQEMLRTGEIAPGQTLPPQRKLAADLAVSRASLREALSILDTLGLIRIEQGRGTFAVATGEPANGATAPNGVPGTWRFAARYAAEEVYQFRLIAEPSAAALAARHATDAQIAQLEQNLRAFKAAARGLDLVSTAQVDFEFHKLIATFSGNRLLADLHHTHHRVVLESQRLPLARRSRLWEAITEHERILKALAMHDPEGAAYYMKKHIHRAADRVGITVVDAGV